jgi:Mrp family chromosome partitioning ATPase
MKELFDILKQKFDYILIDTSPIGLVSDAKSLAPFVDCGLFVTRFNYTPKAKLQELSENLENAAFKKLAIIFNGIDLEKAGAHKGYSYSKYGYGYGESNVSNQFSKYFKGLGSRFF